LWTCCSERWCTVLCGWSFHGIPVWIESGTFMGEVEGELFILFLGWVVGWE
jgi:hypothetical protein